MFVLGVLISRGGVDTCTLVVQLGNKKKFQHSRTGVGVSFMLLKVVEVEC